MLRKILLLLTVSIPVQLMAGTLYNNISASYPIPSPPITFYSDGNGFVGIRFVTTSGGNLSSLVFAGSNTNSGPVTAHLYADSAGIPGSVLETWSVLENGGGFTLNTITSILHPTLLTGTAYWFGIDNPAIQFWGQNDTFVPGGYWSGNAFPSGLVHQVATNREVAFQAFSSDAPEPTTGLLLVAGCFALLRLKRRAA